MRPPLSKELWFNEDKAAVEELRSYPVEKGILEEVLKDPQPSFQLTREIGAYL